MTPAHIEKQRMAWLSIATSIVTMALKLAAWSLTDSVSLFSDALESLVNLSAAVLLLVVLVVAAQPADRKHAYGHDKAEYLASGAEGILILIAAVLIVWHAIERWLSPAPLQQLGLGLGLSLLASACNFATAAAMLKVARAHHSIALEADAKHLMTDVWTSIGVVAALALLYLLPTWTWLDPAIALLVGLNIVHTGIELVTRSLDGLMDAALPPDEQARIEAACQRLLPPDSDMRNLRTRLAGSRRFVEFTLLVPGHTEVSIAHDLCDVLEDAIRLNLTADTEIQIHVEPRELRICDDEGSAIYS